MVKIEEQKKGPTFLIWTQLITIVLLLVIAFQIGSLNANVTGAAIAAIGEKADSAPSIAQAPSQPSAPSAPNIANLVDDDAVKGDPEAPVTIVEFSDFECPYCARFAKETLPRIDEEYIKTGKVKLVYRDFPLSIHRNAQKAGEAAECAGEQGKYYEMHDMLFGEGVAGGVTSFKQYAADLGLDTDEFNKCLDSGQTASEIQADFQAGQSAGIRGTPGFLINGQLLSGAQPFENFKNIIDAELAK